MGAMSSSAKRWHSSGMFTKAILGNARFQVVAVTLPTLLAVIGCGSSRGMTARPSGAAGGVYDAVLKFETTPDCDGITESALKQMAEGLGSTRDQQCKLARSRAYPPAAVVKIRAIRVNGSHATAEVPAEGAGGVKVTQGGKTLVEKLTLIKQGERWLISAVKLD